MTYLETVYVHAFPISRLALAIAAALPVTVAAAEPADDVTQLKPVTVTAQRRSEDAKSVPASISVITPEALDVYGSAGEDVLVLGGRAPSLQAESSFGRTFPRFYIRGLGNTDFDLNASQPVSMVYDDVVLENPTLKGFPIFDLTQVEVLRGPQGTLFGRNTPAGVIKFESVRPAQDVSYYGKSGIGRFGTVNVELAMGGGISERSSVRVSTLLQHRDDYVDNTHLPGDSRGGYDEGALRAQWLYKGDGDFEALFGVRARSLNGGSAIYQSNLIVRGSNHIRPGFRFDRLAQDAQPELDVDTFGASARLSWDLGAFKLYSISAYESVDMFARGDVDGGFGAGFAPPFGFGDIPFRAESGDGIPDHRQLTQEFRLESQSDGPLDWQVGTLIYDEDLKIDNVSYDTLAGSRENGYARQRQENRAYALFGAAGYQIDDRWRVAGGLRYTDDSKDFYAERLVSPIGAGPLARIEVSPSDQNLSGDLSVSYAASDDLQLYARYATGFRAPAIQGRLLFGDVVSVAESETIDSFELGLKADLWDRRARVNFSVYDYRVDDIQLTAVGGQTNFNTLINADRVLGRGAELELDALITSNFSVTAGISYNDTELDDRNLAVQPCGSPCTVLDPAGAVAGTVSIDGNPLPQAPEWISHLTARYGGRLGNGEWYVLTDWSYRSEVNFFLYESREFVGDPLLQGGLRLAYVWGDGSYEAALLGRNILDEIETIGGVDFNNLTGFTNAPRYVGAEFTLRL
jgi:iron complex outermembrane receptor protein